MSLDEKLENAIAEIPECVAAAYIDMESGMLVGAKTVDTHPPEVLALIGAATADLFQGPTVDEIETLFKESRGTTDDPKHYFNEMLFLSEHLVHVFIRANKNPNHVVSYCCRKKANLGMVLTKGRLLQDGIEAALHEA